MLSRALNRGAPQGHFAAYIQPDEAALLRAHGGGVTRGGGQYMANGIPAFPTTPWGSVGTGQGGWLGSSTATGGFGAGQGMADADLSLGSYVSSPDLSIGDTTMVTRNPDTQAHLEAAIADAAARNAFQAAQSQTSQSGESSPVVTTAGQTPPIQTSVPGAADLTPAFLTPANAEAQAQADAHARNMALQSQYMAANARAQADQDAAVSAVQDAPGWQPNQDGMRAVTEAMHANRSPVDNATMTDINLAVIEGQNLSGDARAEALSRNISQGGTGRLSPAARAATYNPDASFRSLRTVNSLDPDTGGYAILNPQGRISAPSDITNMGWMPALAATAIGALTPGAAGALVNLGIMGSGFPTLGSMARNALAPEGSPLGNILALPGEARALITNPFVNALSPVTDALGGVGVASDIAAGITPDFLSHGPPVSTPEGFSGVEVPAPLVPEVVTTDPTDDEPFVRDDTPPREYADLSDALRRRLEQTSSTGYQAIAQSPAGLPEGSFNPSLSQYQEGYYVENPVGSGQYHAVGPPGTSTVAMIFNRDQIPEGSLIAPPGTQYADVFGVQPSQTYEKVGIA